MNIAIGNNIVFERNRIITSGELADGRLLNATYAAVGIFDYYSTGPAHFFDNQITDNVIGYVKRGRNVPFEDRHDYSPRCDGCQDVNTSLPNPIPYQMEVDEFEAWQAKVRASGLLIGPR
jgi:hypothetical protein